jgi:hypothetical protein
VTINNGDIDKIDSESVVTHCEGRSLGVLEQSLSFFGIEMTASNPCRGPASKSFDGDERSYVDPDPVNKTGFELIKQENFKEDSVQVQEKKESLMQGLHKILRPTSMSIVTIFSPAFANFIVLLLRLTVGQNNFQAYPLALDFGPIDGIPGGEPNIAFTSEASSYGHWIQGFFAAFFSFPSVTGIVAQFLLCKSWSEPIKCTCLRVFIQTVSYFMALYPTYNLLKYFNQSQETFATSAYSSHGFEWAFGFVLGTAVGMTATSFLKRAMLNKVMEFYYRYDVDITGGESNEQGPMSRSLQLIRMIEIVLGALFVTSMICASVLLSFFWHSCHDGADDCVNYSENGDNKAILAVLVSLPAVFFCAALMRETMILRSY